MRNNIIIKDRKTRFISVLMYIAAAIFLLLSIFGTAEIAYDYINQTERVRGYNIEDFDNDFQNGDYGNLLKKTAYNRGIGKDIPEDEMDYYLFSDYYNSIINYNVYMKNGDTNSALSELEKCNSYYDKMNHLIFKEKALILKENVNIN